MSSRVGKFVIVCTGRTGSTLLIDLLRSHPQIDCDNELMNKWRWQHWKKPFLWMFRVFPMPYFERRAARAGKPYYGFKLLYSQVTSIGMALDGLNQSGWKFIYLERKDTLRQCVSWSIAATTKYWHRRGDGKPDRHKDVVLNVDDFMHNLERTVRSKEKLAGHIRPYPHLKLVYEEDLKNSDFWPATSEKLFNWLNIPPAVLSTNMLKIGERPYSEVVANYDQIIAAVENSPYRHLIGSMVSE